MFGGKGSLPGLVLSIRAAAVCTWVSAVLEGNLICCICVSAKQNRNQNH